jgi:PAS domain S-box-containing protein
MLVLPGYETHAQIYESVNSCVYRAIRTLDGQPVILKLLKQDYPTPEELVRYRQEYEITRHLKLEGVCRSLSLEKYQNTFVIVFEDFGGESLKNWMSNRQFNLGEFLQIAITTTASLAQVHSANIIHKDINPSNIVYNPNTQQVKIIDFGLSTVLSRENPTLKNPNLLEGTLAYMSPEQTGRMNRSLDYRTDFYSLGATFYELLTNQLPFDTADALELVHCHIAKQPLPPSEVNPEIPQVVSDIVMKLMAKTAEERYQSALGIKADLEQCLNQLHQTGSISDFPLACQDIADKFQIPQKLYGREQEIATLLSAFERVSDKSEMMLVVGYSGIGKSALVQELFKPITQKRSYFISGKFDQYQRNIPYSAIVSAFRELVKQLLTETEAQLQEWREKLSAALGINGQVIIDVIPQVELIIGKQPDVPELGATETHNRFNIVFQNFIKVFTARSHPLAIFLDDLQWADSASLNLIQVLMSAVSPGLFLIGAYRDNEVFPAHPLILTLEDIGKTEAVITHIFLSLLDLFTVTQLISDTLNCSEAKAKPLAELVLFKTGGNPLFMNEFLKSLYTEELLKFDFQSLSWHWNLEQIKARGFTDNVVELIALKIQNLPENTQQMLKLAACIGNQFDLKMLALSCEKSLRETANALHAAVASSLVVSLGSKEDVELALLEREYINEPLSITHYSLPEYKFVHDRIQQSAYSLIPEQQKPIIHRKIGRILLQNTLDDRREEKIFDIVNQLNFGIELIFHQAAKDELAELNLMAGKKAKASAAYQPALNYLQVGIKLLGTDSWQRQYHLTLSLYEQAAEAAYLNADIANMGRFTEAVLSQAKTVLDKVKAYEVKILAYTAQGKFTEAMEIALEVLKLLRIRLPKQPRKIDVLWGLLRTKLIIGFRPIASLVDLPVMTDPYHKAAMRILSTIGAPTYFATPLLMPLSVFQQVSLSLKWGNASESAVAYGCYGLILCGVVGDLELGYQFGQLALNLLWRLNATEVKASTQMLVHSFIRHWIDPVKETLNPLREAYAVGLETGDLQFVAYLAYAYCYHAFLSGSELAKLESEMATYAQVIRQIGQERSVDFHEVSHQAVLNLLGHSENPCYLIGKAYDEQVRLPILLDRSDRTTINNLYFNKLMLCYLFGEVEQAVANAEVAEQYLDSIIGSVICTHFCFYDSLARLAVATDASQSERKRLTQKVLRNQKKMRKWAHHAPMNNSHKYRLVEAELCRVQDIDALARDYYDKAISLAEENEYIHEAALAYELAAKFYLSKGKELTARAYMQEARYSYQLWGATAKVKDLERRYYQLFAVTQPGIKDTKTPTTTTDSGLGSNLDIATVMKASEAISGEIVLDKLLSSLMKILIENAGAQKGYLILASQGKLLIEAQGAIDSEQVTVLQSLPLENCQILSEAIVNYVARTKESVVLNDANREEQFINAPYIKENQPKSILCVPLINQGKLISIVYLENNLTTGAFTPERVEVLKLLSGQAAISIENAKLYREVRENESRLTQFLEAVPMGVFVIDANGTPYYVNRTAQQILGKGVVPNATAEQLAEVYQVYITGTSQTYPIDRMPGVRALSGESTTVDDLEIRQGDKIIPIEVLGTPIYDEKGNISYAIVALQDITERKKAEAERARFTNELFQLNKAYERFVPRQFLQFLEKSSIIDVELGDQVQLEMSVLFSDIRDFTALSEKMTPEDNFKFINSYLSRMEPAITENHGFIDKYIGDAIMALFSGEADNAVKAGIAMLNRLDEYNQHRANSGFAPIQNGIGINTGSLMLGTVGGQNRMDGTVISDAVNLASRIESLTKEYGVSLLISQQTFSRLQNPTDYAIRQVDRVKVKGKEEVVTVYEVFDADRAEVKEKKLATLQTYTEACSYYNLNAYAEAAQRFEDCLRQNPSDRVAQIYLKRTQAKI